MYKKLIASVVIGVSMVVMAQSNIDSASNSTTYNEQHNNDYQVTETQKRAFRLATNILENYHYRKQTMIEIGADIQKDYLNFLDPNHIYFTAQDVENFAQSDEALKRAVALGDLSRPIEIYELYEQRARALNDWTLKRLKQPFDLDTNETVTYYPFERQDDKPWPVDLKAAQTFQEKRLTDQIIRLMLSERSYDKAIETLTKRYESAQNRMNQTSIEDIFDIYMNVIAARFDPHSNYLSPKNSENFEINMRLSLEGIGAVLTTEEDKITIRELMPGGPAAMSGKLKIKDQIIGVAQGEDGEMVDVVGWRLDKAVELIRGKKGSLVRLLLEPANAAQGVHEITLKRDKIALEEQAAQANIETLESGEKIGVLKLPSFYMDFDAAHDGSNDFRSTSRDVAKLVSQLKADKVDGIVLDLRGNGGGSLYEAVQTVGLFIDQGPVVMVADLNNDVRTESDTEAGLIYDGPLAVMIDHYSASASEIFAAAIQDYGRGIVVGSNSYGKGTVQTMIDLNRFVSDSEPALGNLKFTIAMFHRITGGSTQNKGVAPDIELPEGLGLDKVGEMSEPYALPWKNIAAEEFSVDGRVTKSLLAQLQTLHNQRMQTNPVLKRYVDYVARVTERNEKTTWSLNLAQRQQTFKLWKDYQDDYNLIQQEAGPVLKSDDKIRENVDKNNEFIEEEADKVDFVPDIGLYETLNVLNDYIRITSNARLKAA